jgi:hypothetical protein
MKPNIERLIATAEAELWCAKGWMNKGQRTYTLMAARVCADKALDTVRSLVEALDDLQKENAATGRTLHESESRHSTGTAFMASPGVAADVTAAPANAEARD